MCRLLLARMINHQGFQVKTHVSTRESAISLVYKNSLFKLVLIVDQPDFIYIGGTKALCSAWNFRLYFLCNPWDESHLHDGLSPTISSWYAH